MAAELTLPPWLGPGEPAGLPMARGVQAGSAIRSNFLRAREQRMQQEQFAVQMQARSEAAAIENRLHQQQLALTKLKVAELVSSRDLALTGEASVAAFSDVVGRSIQAGPSDPKNMNVVLGFISRNRGVILNDAGDAIYKQWDTAVQKDRLHTERLAEITARGDVALQTQGAMGVRQEGVEATRAASRMTLEEFKADKREDLTKLRASLSVTESGGVVTPAKFVDRHLNTILSLMPYTTDPEQIRRNVGVASSILLEDYDEKLSSMQKAPAAAASTPADAGADRFQTEADARTAGKNTGDVIELWDAGTGRFRRARLR